MEDAGPAQSPLPPRGESETTEDRISRIAREIAKAEGRVYLGDPLKHPVTNEVTVKPCGTPQPDPWAFVISAKESARAETARMMASPKPESERMSEEARNLARMGMPLGDNPYVMQTEAQEKWSGRGFSPSRGKRQDSAGGMAPENNGQLHLEWAKIQSIQPRLRLKPEEVADYGKYKGTRFYKEAAFDEVRRPQWPVLCVACRPLCAPFTALSVLSCELLSDSLSLAAWQVSEAEQKRELMEKKAAMKAEYLG